MMENRNGLLVQTFLTEPNGRADPDAAMLMAEALPSGKRVTLGGEKLRHSEILTRTPRDKHYPTCGTERYEPQERGG
jgi:hypothetical protein